MKIKSSIQPSFPSKGITIIEILLVISLLVIVVSFAIPSVGGATARAEMTAAQENLQHAVQAARNLARINESGMTVQFGTASGSTGQVVRILDLDSGTPPVAGGLQDYLLPESVQLISNEESFDFDERGLAENPGEIILVSRVDDSIRSTVEVK